MSSAGGMTRWFGELKRRKVFRVAAMYVVATWLLLQLADVTFEPLGLPPWAQTFVIVLAAVGFPFACILAWAYDVKPTGIERTPSLETPTTPIDKPAPPSAAPPSSSVAILAFSDMSPERDQEYFCDGIAEEIINSLCCVKDLRVAARTSSFQFKNRAMDSREIGRQLGVTHLLEGSVRKAGNRVRVTAQLIDTATGYHRWSQTFERELADVFAIQSEIAQCVVRSLRVTISPQEASRLELRGTRNPEAYDCYLRGRHLVWQTSDTSWRSARVLFRHAVELDPQFAQAWAELASCIANEYSWRLEIADPAVIDEALAASERARTLAPGLPEARVANGLVLMMLGRLDESASAFEEAVDGNPGLFDAWYHYGRLCIMRGEFVRAVELFEHAMTLDPDDFQSVGLLAMAKTAAGQVDDPAPLANELIERAQRYLARSPEDARAHCFLGGAYVQIGRIGEGLASAERAIELRPHEFSTLYNAACVYVNAHEDERALELLDAAVAQHRGNLDWIERDSDWIRLRDDPRFTRIVARLQVDGSAE
jgi:adenylate cyclase